MGNLDTLKRLFQYKEWANSSLLEAMESMDSDAPSTEIAIRALNHTLVVDRIFAAHLQGIEHPYGSANEEEAPSLANLAAGMTANDRWYVDYVSDIDERGLNESLDFTFTDGAPGRMSRHEMLMHVVVHGGYHRGQVGWMLTLEGIAPPADGVTSYLHSAEPSTRRRNLHDGTRQHIAGDTADQSSSDASDHITPEEHLRILTARLRASLEHEEGLKKSVKFDFKGAGYIFIEDRCVLNEDRPADLTLTISLQDLRAIGQGKLSPMSAVTTKRLGVSNLGMALGLQSKLKTLFAASA